MNNGLDYNYKKGAWLFKHPPHYTTQDSVLYAWGRKANLAWFGIQKWGAT